MKNILITGGAGFIGSRLALHLLDKGYNITVLDNLSKQIHGSSKNSYLYNSIKDKVNFILGDVCKISDWRLAIKNQSAVIHLAAETGTGQSMYEVTKYNHVNVLGTTNLFDVLANESHNIQKILIASSRAVYGEGRYFSHNFGDVYPLSRSEKRLKNKIFEPSLDSNDCKLILKATHEEAKISPASIYAVTKYNQEQVTMLMGKTLNIPVISLRYQNVYGPGQSLSNPYTGILSVFSTRLLNNNDLEIYEDGNQSRDFIYIDDVVDATTLALEKDDKLSYVLNVGYGKPISVLSVAKQLMKNYEKNQKINITGKYRLGDIRHNYADLTQVKNTLGFYPKFTFAQGILNFTNWVRQQKVENDMYVISENELKNKGLLK
tara:strand:+ start:85634 stop:86764 length:1131 start_codon:yes stop_codon:yes gene_type:complete